MTLIIVTMLILSLVLIATGHLTGVNKAAIAMFLGTVGWVVYVCWGADFVMDRHPVEYLEWLAGREATSETVKYFIYNNVFLKYVGKAAAIVMFLLATMSIVELLNNNGCFDFIKEWIRTRNSKRLLWTITLATFILSANLDNLTTTMTMLVIMHSILQNSRQRMYVGSAIVLAANCGGCFTVIGDPTGLILWGDGAVTASHFSAYLALPAILAWVVPTIMINRELPDRLDVAWSPSPYRGDDTRLNRWQRVIILIVGIGGLWFIPTFHNITKLAPFLGALCVLSVLWVVNEAFNRKLMAADQMTQRRIPMSLQYGALQQMLFIMGIMLGMGVITETGVWSDVADWFDTCRLAVQRCRLLHHSHFQHLALYRRRRRRSCQWLLLEHHRLFHSGGWLSALRGQHQRYCPHEDGARPPGLVFQTSHPQGPAGLDTGLRRAVVRTQLVHLLSFVRKDNYSGRYHAFPLR